MSSAIISSLIPHIKSGIPVITVNVRLSRRLRHLYDHEMKSDGLAQWQSPVIMPLSAWVNSLWQESWPDAPLLSPVRSKAVWERVVSRDSALAAQGILSTQGVVDTSYKAYSLMREYRLPFPDDIYLTEEAAALKRWIRTYNTEIDKLGFVSPLTLTERVMKLISGGRITIPGEIILAGFDEITPRSASLLRVIETVGSTVAFWPDKPERLDSTVKLPEMTDMPDMTDRLTVRRYADMTEEVVQAARWCREVIDAHPGTTIGFIVPELERYRSVMEHEFSAELAPASLSSRNEASLPFNISLGVPLSWEPLVKLALDILSIDGKRHDIDTISSILLSPYFASGDAEYHCLAQMEAWFRKENALHINLTDLLQRVKSDEADGGTPLTAFAAQVEAWRDHLSKSREKCVPSRWAKEFNALLSMLGWGAVGDTLDSGEYQLLKAWHEVLSNFSGLDDICEALSRSEAVSRITRMATETIHQPEAQECPIQILGTLEATSGHYFDHIWLLGCHDEAFPPQPSPNPFIPLFTQRERNLPHSSPERELAFTGVVLRRVLQCAPHIEVSWPEVVDEKAVRLSPLIRKLGGRDGSSIIKAGSSMRDAVHSRYGLEEMTAEWQLPLATGEMEAIRGGTSIIKNQSACPFKAFATHRLNASGINVPEPGFTAAQRGSNTHRALRNVWQEVKDSARLGELIESGDIGLSINRAVDEALRGITLFQRLSRRYLELERRRLINLLEEWLTIESGRTPFTVKETEERREITIGGLTIRAQFDRIDQLADGRQALLDYKTGGCSRNDWLSERPKEPQLPLYTLAGRYNAIAFGQVKVGDCRFKGIAKDGETLPGIKSLKDDKRWIEMVGTEEWDAMMGQWRDVVNKLVKGFVSGDASVDPATWGSSTSPCDHCDQRTLCRIFEVGQPHPR
ncbi:MAG: PD-(D/E)XK nuclease family protein [Thermodesulfobacteriota bacterium]